MKAMNPSSQAALAVFGSLGVIIIYVIVGKSGAMPLPILPMLIFAIIGPGWGVYLGTRALRGNEGRAPAIASIIIGALIVLVSGLYLALFIFAVGTLH
ncbi:MAG TPA: hypothetical protein VM658_05450 [bacterium]|nr:hypothetical protein [bacterium]